MNNNAHSIILGQSTEKKYVEQEQNSANWWRPLEIVDALSQK